MNDLQFKNLPLPSVRAVDLDGAEEQPRWLVENIWSACGVGLIGGTPKSLKTWLGLELAVSVASGKACLDRFAVQHQGPALIYLAEDRLCMIRERLQALCAHRQMALESLDLHVITVPSLRLDHDIDVHRLHATVAQVKPRILLLDPFVRLVHKADENSAQDVAGILAALRELQRRHDVAIVVTHHSRKNGRASQHGQALRGSGDFHAWADSALYLNHQKGSLRLTIEHRAAPPPEPISVRLVGQPTHLAIVDEELAQTAVINLDERVSQALRKSPTPLPRDQLRASLAVNNAKLGHALSRLERSGCIRRTPDGWTPAKFRSFTNEGEST